MPKGRVVGRTGDAESGAVSTRGRVGTDESGLRAGVGSETVPKETGRTSKYTTKRKKTGAILERYQ